VLIMFGSFVLALGATALLFQTVVYVLGR
jgi:hypothetical protein